MSQISDMDRENFRDVFGVFDQDHDGRIDFHELMNAMRALGFEPSKKQVLDILKRHDADGARYINQADFEREMARLVAARDPLDEIKRVFQLFSPDGAGITFESLKTIARDLGEAIGDDELQSMIQEFDLDEDGRISLDEFIRICST